jgi:site-specific recombinase XerD
MTKPAPKPDRHVYYPNDDMPFRAQLAERDQRFEDVCEEVLLDYGRNTARAYAADLDDVYAWCEAHSMSIFTLSGPDFNRYLESLAHLGYSLNTLRRRRTSFRHLCRAIAADRE